ncbi:hypothetical protein [uncultured Nostoc sp.]|uniref:hypothetical protein n=1 Tax=uncultured Nostoc sp. TaxID=340711 RepID=UPI0035C9DAEC
MTTTAPNLGKLFNSRTSRPATPEDIALLASGDWISEKDCPWSWQFKNSCQDMAVGVWEGKEFFIPHHLLMVCEIIEGQVVEKFFKKPEIQDLKQDYAELKVGDRISILKTRTKNLSQWVGKTALITAINGETISVAAGDGKKKKHLTLKKGWYEIIDTPQELVTELLAENECTQQSQANKTISEKYHKGYRIESARQSHCLVYWGDNPQKFKRIFDEAGVVKNADSWNPADFGEVPHQIELSGQATIFYDTSGEPPDPDDFTTIEEFEEAWKRWELGDVPSNLKFAYKQLRQKGIGHQDAIAIITS